MAEYDGEAWAWHLDDGLGSVRQLSDGDATVTLAQGYTPFGVPLLALGAQAQVWSQGGGETVYGFTGEQWEALAGLLFLRARYYGPGMGRFTSKDAWMGDALRPSTGNAFVYVLNNPINWMDASGLLSSSPIEAIIQAKYMETYASSYPFGIMAEFSIPGGSKQGLDLDTSGPVPQLVGTPTGELGRADLVGLYAPTEGHLYEIKNRQLLFWAIAEVSWYIARNEAVRQQPGFMYWPSFTPGILYTWAPEEDIIGTNPAYAGQWIVANMQVPGVISWWGRQKSEKEPLPRYVWEWDPVKEKVEKRELYPVPAYAACSNPELAQAVGEGVGKTVIIGGVGYIVWRVIKVAIGGVLAGPPGAGFMAVTP